MSKELSGYTYWFHGLPDARDLRAAEDVRMPAEESPLVRAISDMPASECHDAKLRDLAFIARRLVGTLPLLVGVGVFTFILVRVLPGDPAAYYATGPLAIARGDRRRCARRSASTGRCSNSWSAIFGISPPAISAARWSPASSVGRDLAERFPASFELTLVAMIARAGDFDSARHRRGDSRGLAGSIISCASSARSASRCRPSSPASC